MKRTAIITGGTKGLGREIALAFGRGGYSVVAFYSSDEIAAEQLRAALAEAKAEGRVLRHDVTVENSAIWTLPEIEEAESLTLIHNACSAFSPVPMHQLNWQDFERNLNVALKGGWLCSQALIRLMLKKKPSTIVNILTSALDGLPPKGFAAYVASKHALRGLTLALASEYGPRGVRVFSASPGYMDTPLTEAWDERFRDAIRSGSTRITHPAEAAQRLMELVGDETLAGQGEDYPI